MTTTWHSQLPYYFYRLGGAVLPRIPPRLGYRLAEAGGALARVLAPGAWRRVCHNLAHVLGEGAASRQVRHTARQMFGNLLKNYYDLFRLPYLTLEACDQLVEAEGWQHLEAALSQGKGLILATAHLGNLEITPHVLALRGLTVFAPVERLEPPRLFDYICRLRVSHGLRLLPVDGPLLTLVRALRQGQVVALAADLDVTASGQMVNFFGTPTFLPTGYVRLALRTGAPILCAFTERLPNNRFRAYALPPLNLTPSGDQEADVMAGVKQVVAVVEQAIARRPAQWYVTQAIWPPDAGAA